MNQWGARIWLQYDYGHSTVPSVSQSYEIDSMQAQLKCYLHENGLISKLQAIQIYDSLISIKNNCGKIFVLELSHHREILIQKVEEQKDGVNDVIYSNIFCPNYKDLYRCLLKTCCFMIIRPIWIGLFDFQVFSNVSQFSSK